MTSVPWVCALYFIKAFLFFFIPPTSTENLLQHFGSNGVRTYTTTTKPKQRRRLFSRLFASSLLLLRSGRIHLHGREIDNAVKPSGVINTQQWVTKEYQLISQNSGREQLSSGMFAGKNQGRRTWETIFPINGSFLRRFLHFLFILSRSGFSPFYSEMRTSGGASGVGDERWRGRHADLVSFIRQNSRG